MHAMKQIVIILLYSFISIDSKKLLPTLDVLSTGFDLKDLKSKAKIFDIESEKESSVYIRSLDESFQFPSYVTVVTDGSNLKRVEESCSGVFNSFESYCDYLKITIDVDVAIKTDNFRFGLTNHLEIKRVYDAIKEKNQAIGVSELWWGIYEMHLPPGFLLSSKLSEYFKESINLLNKKGIPSTEKDQKIYNEICCSKSSFGTHYVSSVIAGGRVRMSTFINSSYHTSHKESVVEDQIAIEFEYEKVKLSAKGKFNKTKVKNTEEFVKNTHQYVNYQPAIKDIHGNKAAPLSEWENTVLKDPIAVNKTLTPITDLFIGNEDVKRHMEKTIKFYLIHKRAPKLSDIRLVNSMGSSSNLISNVIPGIDVVGNGFDATTLSPTNNLFKKTIANLPTSTWSNPYNSNMSYKIPYGYFATNSLESDVLNGTFIIDSLNDYMKKSKLYERQHDSGFLGLGSSNDGKTTSKYFRMLYAHNYKLALSQRKISWYTLHLLEFPLLPFSDSFKSALDYLPSTYDPRNQLHIALTEMFFKSFGTDVILSVDMGGMIWDETWFESCLTKIYSEYCIINEIEKTSWFVKKKSKSYHCDKKIKNDLFNETEHFSGSSDGLRNSSKHIDWKEWYQSVSNNPRPVRYVLAPIYHLLYESNPKKTALIAATQDFLKRSEDKKLSIIDTLKMTRPPLPSICEKTTFAQYSASNVGNAKNDLSQRPSDVLCPFVGYHGKFCPPSPHHKSLLYSNSLHNRSLPRGVGVTIDITTGMLKLPAIDYQNSPSTWVDPLSGVSYSIPFDVSLAVEGFPRVPTIRIFKTVEELASIWEDGYKDGKWLGGEFGQRKSVLELYMKFFSKDQKTSINQFPHALYNLTLKGNWEKRLNKFVVKALRLLPKKYDANIYSRFMDTWGTHIATKTLVGGMKEQQVTLKSCLSKKSPSSKGLTLSQLKQYLQKELANIPTYNPFYEQRRKMTINHQIGGNPEVTDEKKWIQTLSLNPVLIKIYSSVDWSSIVRNGNITNKAVAQNLVRALVERMRITEKETRKQYSEVKEKMKKQSHQDSCPPYSH